MALFAGSEDSVPFHTSKRKVSEGPPVRSKRARDSVSLPASGAEDSEYSDGSSPNPQKPSPATPLTPFSPSHKFPSDLKTHHCPYNGCSKSFNRPARLAEHLRSHTNERPFKCKVEGCEKDFLRETHLNHHVKSAHTDVRDYTCTWEGCGKKFLTATRLRRHEAAHEGREKYRCTQYAPCNETFRKHSTLQKHITSVHLKQKPYPCTQVDPETGLQCTHGFETAGKLRAHEGRIHGGARFWCSECGDTSMAGVEITDAPDQGLGFPTYALLQEHIRITHPPTCVECSQQCATQRELKQHVEIQHGNLSLEERRNHLCTYLGCGRGFTKKGNLIVHTRTVHGEKQFICGHTDLATSKRLETWDGANACGNSFTTKGNLEEHVRAVHLGIPNTARAKTIPKPKKITKQPSTLTKLTGVGYADETGRSIVCPEAGCAYRFLRTYDLEVHLRTRHGLTDSHIDSLITSPDELVDGRIWVGEGYVNEDDKIAEREMEREFDVEAELERMAAEGGEFWVGGGHDDVERDRDEWEGEGESVEMRRLVGGECGDGNRMEMNSDERYAAGGRRQGEEEEGVIDPVLRFLEKEVV